MKAKLLHHSFCMMLLAMATFWHQPLLAGGAAMVFHQTWTVNWASTADSLKFAAYIARKGEQSSACDVRDCDLCRIQQSMPSSKFGWPLLSSPDCAHHSTDANHDCGNPGEWVTRLSTPGIGGASPAATCDIRSCAHCQEKAFAHLRTTGKVCAHHGIGIAHYCHGRTIEETTIRDMNPRLDFLEQRAQLAVPSVQALDAASGVQEVSLVSYVPELFLNQHEKHLEDAVLSSKGRFIVHFPGTVVFPITLMVTEPGSMEVMRMRRELPWVAFDVADFPQGIYQLTAQDAGGHFWHGRLMLATSQPPHPSTIGYGE